MSWYDEWPILTGYRQRATNNYRWNYSAVKITPTKEPKHAFMLKIAPSSVFFFRLAVCGVFWATVLVGSGATAWADATADRQAEYHQDYYDAFRNASDLGTDADTTINVALAAIALNKPQADIDAVNTALSQYFTGKEDYWNGKTGGPAAIDGYWASRTIASVLMDSNLTQHITADNQAKMKAFLYSYSVHRDELKKASLDAADRGRIYESGNHDMHSRMVLWGAAQILKDDPAYADMPFIGGQTAEQRYGVWTTNLLDYFQDRAGKGGTVEVDSTVYAATYHSPVFNIAEYAEDPRLKAIAREYLNLHMADLAQRTTEGISGGAKSRAGKNRVQTPNEHRSVQYLYLFAGHPDEGMGVGVVPGGAQLGRILGGATTTDYRLPQEIVDMVADEDSRGSFMYHTNRMGEGTRTSGALGLEYIPAGNQSNLLHSTRVTPDYTLGWFTTDENRGYMEISTQTQAFFAITDATRTSRLVMNLTGGKNTNELQGVGDGDAMMFRRQINRNNGETPRVYIADDFTYGLETDGWFFGTDNSGSYFAIKGVLPSDGSTVSHLILDVGDDGGPGKYLTYSNDDAVVVVQMGQASAYTDFAAFKADILDNPLTVSGGAVTYNPGPAGGELTMFNTRALPQVNGQAVDVTPAKVYDSPYLNADYGAKTVSFTDLNGQNHLLDFDYNPVAPIQSLATPANTALADTTFSPGFREMVGVTEFSSDSVDPLTYTIDSTAVMQIDFDAHHDVTDQLIVNGTLVLDGELRINMIRDVPLVGGTYQLFQANSITGEFDTITLPPVGEGLAWDTSQLAVDGTISLGFTTPGAALAIINTDSKVVTDASSALENNPSTHSFDAGAVADLLIVAISSEKSTEPYSVAYNGVAMTMAVSGNTGSSADIWYLVDPFADGAASLTVDFTGVGTVNGYGMGILSLSSGGEAVEVHATATSLDGSHDSVSLNTTASESFVVAAYNGNLGGSVSVSGPLTQIYASNDIGSAVGAAGYHASVTSGSHAYSFSSTSPRSTVAAAFALATGGNNFSDWIADYPEAGELTGLADDPDGDGIPNAVEAVFGTHPAENSSGFADLGTDRSTTTFTHPMSDNPPGDLSLNYQWSTNLADWYAGDGVDGPLSGESVSITAQTLDATAHVTATASPSMDHLFLRLLVIQE